MFIDCGNCTRGRIVEEGFDGRTARQCRECHGAGEIELTADETAIMESFLAACAAGVEAVETVAEVSEFLGAQAPATPLPQLVHEGMDAEWFDRAVRRAFDRELTIAHTSRASVVAVSSSRDADVSYLVTATDCQCEGHRHGGKCMHRAYAIWHWWVTECDAVAIAAHTPEMVAA